jgi:flagellar biosynthesis/type III secretory pathway M-ring protein FliF/YscJ
MFYDGEEELEIPTAGKTQVTDNRDIVKMALEDPNKTALLIRNWIQEKK